MTINMKRPVLLLLITGILLIAALPVAAQIRKETDTLGIDTGLKAPVKLREVNIKGFRDTRLDSLFNRKQFAGVFSHKGPGLADLFSQKVSYNNQYSPFQNSTSSIAGINLLSIPGLLGKKSSQAGKLKARLLRDEETGYVERAFSKTLVSSVTNLQGDSLQLFRDRYRPSYTFAKQTTAYDMILYIKKSMQEFKQSKSE